MDAQTIATRLADQLNDYGDDVFNHVVRIEKVVVARGVCKAQCIVKSAGDAAVEVQVSAKRADGSRCELDELSKRLIEAIAGQTNDLDVTPSKAKTKTKAQATRKATPSRKAAAQVRTPFPDVAERPYTGRFEGRRERGEYVNGRRQGPWREYDAAENVTAEAPYLDGMPHGIARTYADDGGPMDTETIYAHGVMVESTFFHPNGTRSAHQHYNARGEPHGTYTRWDDAGKVTAEGAYKNGSRHGLWKFHVAEPPHEKSLDFFFQGIPHGEWTAWYIGGKVAYRTRFVLREVVDTEDFDESGELTDCTKTHGRIRTAWQTRDGIESTERFIDGLPESLVEDRSALKKLAKRVSAATSRYDKLDILGEHTMPHRAALFVHLWREGLLDPAKELGIAELLVERSDHIAAAELMTLLRRLTPFEGEGNRVCPLPGWSAEIDMLVAEVYAREPGPIAAGWRDLPAFPRKGVAFVLARFGVDVGGALKGVAAALARHFFKHHFSELVWPTTDAAGTYPEYANITPGEPNSRYEELLALVGRDEFVATLRKLSFADQYACRTGIVDPLWPLASLEELVRLLAHDERAEIPRILLEWRSDPQELLAELVAALKDAPSQSVVAACAVIKYAEAKLPIPSGVVAAFVKLDAATTTQWANERARRVPDDYKYDPGALDAAISFAPAASGDEPLFKDIYQRAVRALPAAAARSLVEREVVANQRRALPFLHLVDDVALWQRAFELAGDDDLTTLGLGLLPLHAVPHLADAAAKTRDGAVSEALRRALILVLARATSGGEAIPEAYDKHLRVDFADTNRYHWHNVGWALRKVLHHLSRPRAEAVLVRLLSSTNPDEFARAFELISTHPTGTVCSAAFTGLVDLQSVLDSASDAIARGIGGLPEPKPWARWLLASGGTAYEHVLVRTLGKDAVEAAKTES